MEHIGTNEVKNYV